MGKTFRVATRSSPLALRQVEEVLSVLKKIYPLMDFEIVSMDTYGDKDKTTPISEIEGRDFFTREIDEALLKGEIDPSTMLRVNGERSRTIDFAVHSAKDLPDDITNGLVIAAITRSIDPYDALVSKDNLKIDQLSLGAKIGASSNRRKMQLKKYRRDFKIVDIRGTIKERLKVLDTDGLDAIIVAECALLRLGLADRIAQRMPFDILRPHPLQGALAVVVRTRNTQLFNLLSVIDSRKTVSL